MAQIHPSAHAAPVLVPLNLSAQKCPHHCKTKGDVDTWTAGVSSWRPAQRSGMAAEGLNILPKPEHLMIHPCSCGLFRRSQAFFFVISFFCQEFWRADRFERYVVAKQQRKNATKSHLLKGNFTFAVWLECSWGLTVCPCPTPHRCPSLATAREELWAMPAAGPLHWPGTAAIKYFS